MVALLIRRARPMNNEGRIHRNQTCPCGSGKRFKHCHGRYPLPIDYTASGGVQFHEPRIDPLSPAVTPIELIQNDIVFGHGTGFIWKSAGRVFLVTNWHNLSGQHPFDSSHLNEGGRVADTIRCYPTTIQAETQNLVRHPVSLPLFETFHEPKWIQHKHFFEIRIDIAIIELTNVDGLPIPSDYLALNRSDEHPKLFSHVGSDVFIVGYPFFEFEDLLKFPLWKRGSIASEPLIGWKRKPIFLIDAASRPGMSGSPVIRKIFGPAPIPQDNTFVIRGDNVMTQEFIGVYSGHLNRKSEDVTIGFAWYGNLIDEILTDPDAGTRL